MFGDLELEAMYQDLLGRAELAGLRTVNASLRRIYEESQIRVPKGDPTRHLERSQKGDLGMGSAQPYPERQLSERAEVVEATLINPTGMVVYEGPYAAAQETGIMVYESRKNNPVDWEAHDYTVEGTGAHYLEDSLKLVAGQLGEEIAVEGRIAFGELPGVSTPKSTVGTAGRTAERLPPPTGEVAQSFAREQSAIQSASETSFIKPTAPPITQ